MTTASNTFPFGSVQVLVIHAQWILDEGTLGLNRVPVRLGFYIAQRRN